MAQWRATRRNFRRTHAARHYCIASSRHRQRREQGWIESVFPKCSHSGNQKRKQRAHQRRKKRRLETLMGWQDNERLAQSEGRRVSEQELANRKRRAFSRLVREC